MSPPQLRWHEAKKEGLPQSVGLYVTYDPKSLMQIRRFHPRSGEFSPKPKTCVTHWLRLPLLIIGD